MSEWLRKSVLCLFVLCHASVACSGSDQDAVRHLLLSIFDKPEARLVAEPVVVAGDHAIAGWSQGDTGGRALLRRRHGAWSLILCGGDGIRTAEALQEAGVPTADAAALASRLADAERTLDPRRLALFATFGGTVMMDPAGHHSPVHNHTTPAPTIPTFKGGAIVIESPWLHASQPAAKAAGGYMKITNAGKAPDRLVGGTLEGAHRFEVSEMAILDGSIVVLPVARGIEILAGQTVELKPGGHQVTALDVQRVYAKGDTVDGTLVFEKAGALRVTYAVPLPAPASSAQEVGSPGRPFELTDHHGQAFSSKLLAGRPYALLFGFTHCPDVCPTTLLMMSNNLAALGRDADKLRVVFVTVDPLRDTPDHLRAYLASFDPEIIALTGSEERIDEMAKGWNAFYERLPDGEGRYTIFHSAHVYLMDRNNRLFGTMNFQDSEADQLAKLKSLLAGNAN